MTLIPGNALPASGWLRGPAVCARWNREVVYRCASSGRAIHGNGLHRLRHRQPRCWRWPDWRKLRHSDRLPRCGVNASAQAEVREPLWLPGIFAAESVRHPSRNPWPAPRCCHCRRFSERGLPPCVGVQLPHPVYPVPFPLQRSPSKRATSLAMACGRALRAADSRDSWPPRCVLRVASRRRAAPVPPVRYRYRHAAVRVSAPARRGIPPGRNSITTS